MLNARGASRNQEPKLFGTRRTAMCLVCPQSEGRYQRYVIRPLASPHDAFNSKHSFPKNTTTLPDRMAREYSVHGRHEAVHVLGAVESNAGEHRGKLGRPTLRPSDLTFCPASPAVVDLVTKFDDDH